MERFRTEEDDATKGLVAASTSSQLCNETTTTRSSTTRQQADSDDEVMCEAMHLALAAIHLDIAWHTGVIRVEAAMERLHHEIVETVSRCIWSDRTIGPEESSRSPMPAAAVRRKTFCGSGNECSLSLPVVRRRLNREEQEKDGEGQR